MNDDMSVELEALAWKALESKAKTEKITRAATLNQRYREGRTEHVRTPLGDNLGYVNKSMPEPAWKVTNQGLLEDFIRATFPGGLRTVYVLHTPSGSLTLQPDDELVHVLLEHAAHMLVETDEVDEDTVTALVEQSAEENEAAAPGISWVAPSGVVSVNPTKTAFDAVMRMSRAGLLDLTSMRLLELPVSEQEAS